MPGGFADWLRHLPLKEGQPPVLLFDGTPKWNQGSHFAVLAIDVGSRNLQQCADAVIRLRAEYLFSRGDYESIHFNFTSGDTASFLRWARGYRPVVRGNRVRWSKAAAEDSSHSCFRRYLDSVFMYAGTYSLSQELERVGEGSEMRIGDVFIEGGFPGHAVIVIDMAINRRTGDRMFLLAQSYMPAQEIHILRNPADKRLNPWYRLGYREYLDTPEWAFYWDDLKRFP